MDPRLRILRMLEEGKITVDEAARLLEALSRSEPYRYGSRRFRRDVIDSISQFIESTISFIGDEIRDHLRVYRVGSESKIDTPIKPKVKIKSMAGDVTIKESMQSDRVKVYGYSIYKSVKDDELMIESLEGDIEVELPSVHELYISVIHGSIEGTLLGEHVEAKTLSGDIELELKSITDGELETASGDIIVYVPKDANLTIDAETKAGDLTYDVTGECIEEGPGYLKLKLNRGEHTLKLHTASGDIEIREA